MNENIITIKQWQEKRESNKSASLTKDYYELLSFDQLISESKHLRKLIVLNNNSNQLSLKIKFLFDEIQHRMISSKQKSSVENFIQSARQL